MPALFYCMVAEMIVGDFGHYCTNKKLIMDVLCHSVIYLCIVIIYGVSLDLIPFYSQFMRMYPFFCLGVFFSRYEFIKNAVLNSNIFSSICYLSYVFLICVLSHSHGIYMSLRVTAFFAIPLLVYLFYRFDNSISSLLSFVGRYSLEIYVLHWFMLPSLIILSSYCHSIPNGVLDNGNFIVVGMISFIISCPIVILCIMLGRVMHSVYVVDKLVWGNIDVSFLFKEVPKK